MISSGHTNSKIIAPSYISDIAEPHDTYNKRSISPTLNYFLQASQSCSPCPYRDAQKNFKARLAFEVDIHPGSYKIGPPSQGGLSSGSGILIDAHFKLDETEWLTKEKGNTAIKALLVHLEPVLS